MKLLVGADPEIFVENISSKEIISAHLLNIPGTKKEPYPVDSGAVQVDGTALEFNIKPTDNKNDFRNNIQKVMHQLASMIPQDHKFSNNVTAVFENIGSFPETARMIGCDPDFNAYTKKQNAPQTEKRLGKYRFAGGHVHIGWTEGASVDDYEHFLSCCTIARQMDWMLLLPSLLFDNDQLRAGYYGNCGTFRPKPYGVEYRSLSNAWLQKPEYMEIIFEQAIKGVNMYIEEDIDLTNKYGVSNLLNLVRVSRPPGNSRREYLKSNIKNYPEVYADIKDLVDAA